MNSWISSSDMPGGKRGKLNDELLLCPPIKDRCWSMRKFLIKCWPSGVLGAGAPGKKLGGMTPGGRGIIVAVPFWTTYR